MEQKCKYCRYWASVLKECRRHPPRTFLKEYNLGTNYASQVYETHFPNTDEQCWCGEWKELTREQATELAVQALGDTK